MKCEYSFDGNPEGHIFAPQGSLCRDLSSPTIYRKTGGLSNTGWIVLAEGTTPPSSGGITLVDTAPTDFDDFTMFEGGTAPTDGFYVAKDAAHLWWFKGGDSLWSRNIIETGEE